MYTDILVAGIYAVWSWEAEWRTPVLSVPQVRDAAVCGWVYMAALKTGKLQASSLNDLPSWSIEDEPVSLEYQSLPCLILFFFVVTLLPHSLDSVLRDYLLAAASLTTDTENNNALYHPHQQNHTHHHKSISTIAMICLMARIIVCPAITFYHCYHHPHPMT